MELGHGSAANRHLCKAHCGQLRRYYLVLTVLFDKNQGCRTVIKVITPWLHHGYAMVTQWLRLFDIVLFSDNPLLEELKPKHADKVLEALATDLPLKYVVAFYVQCNYV